MIKSPHRRVQIENPKKTKLELADSVLTSSSCSRVNPKRLKNAKFAYRFGSDTLLKGYLNSISTQANKLSEIEEKHFTRVCISGMFVCLGVQLGLQKKKKKDPETLLMGKNSKATDTQRVGVLIQMTALTSETSVRRKPQRWQAHCEAQQKQHPIKAGAV